jgi:DNA primase
MAVATANIKQLVKIEEVIQFYGVRLNKSKAVCPFHKDTKPSLSVKNQYFKCFSCNESGDAIDFVMKLYGLGYRQAVLKLNHDFNLGLNNEKPDKKTTDRIRNELIKKEKIKQFEKLVFEFMILELKSLKISFKALEPKFIGEELTDEFISVICRMNDVNDWLANRGGRNARA